MDVMTVAPLSPLDNVMARYYAKFLLCLSLKPDQDPTTVYTYLQEALTRTVAQLPFLNGRIVTRAPTSRDSQTGRLELRYAAQPSVGVTARLTSKDLSAIDYDDLMEAGLPEEALDGEMLLPAAFRPDLDKGADVFVTQANFVKGGCLLGVGIYHSVTDGSGLNTIMKLWAAHCESVTLGRSETISLDISPESLDREMLKKLWCTNNSESEPGKIDTSEELWRLLGLNPTSLTKAPATFAPEAPSSSMLQQSSKVVTSIFYVNSSSFSALKTLASQDAPGHGISANDALMALLWRAIMSARFPNAVTDKSTEEAILDATIDGRAHFSPRLPSSYLGNVILINTTSLPLSTLIASSTKLSDVALAVRRSVDTITAPKLDSAFLIASSIQDYTTLTFPFATFEGFELCVTSLLNLPLFELNFGGAFGNGGKPEAVRPPRAEFDAVCRRCMVLPMREHGGFEILISLFEEEMERLMMDQEFVKYARFSTH